jgi:hypothetical protein
MSDLLRTEKVHLTVGGKKVRAGTYIYEDDVPVMKVWTEISLMEVTVTQDVGLGADVEIKVYTEDVK